MKRVLSCLLLFALVACHGDGSLTERDVRRLVPDASGFPQAELEAALEGDFGPWCFDSHPLTLLLVFLKGEPSDEFRPLTRSSGSYPWVVTASDRATWLPAECLFDIETRTEGDRASGSFRFRREGLLEGQAEFVAERRDGAWRMTEFRLPKRDEKTTLLADGTWRTNLRQDWNSPERWRSRELGRIEAQLPRDRDITLRVLDPQGGPVAGAHVLLQSRAIEGREEITASDGRARFAELPAGEMRFWVERWRPLAAREPVVRPIDVSAIPNGQEIDMSLRRGVAIQGLVTNAVGEPVREARVQIGIMGNRWHGLADTDASGRWQLVALPGELHWIDAYHFVEHTHAVAKEIVPGDKDVVLQLRAKS